MTGDEAERALIAERVLAEQEERRRLAELLHDGPVQQLSAIAQILDTGLADLGAGDAERAAEVVARALELARDAARDLRALCDDLEPRVLDQLGFAAAASGLCAPPVLASRRRDRPRRRPRGRAGRERLRRPLPDPPRGGRAGRSAGNAVADRASRCARPSPAESSSSSPTTGRPSAARRCSRPSPSERRR